MAHPPPLAEPSLRLRFEAPGPDHWPATGTFLGALGVSATLWALILIAAAHVARSLWG
jgi:hypothetical protein